CGRERRLVLARGERAAGQPELEPAVSPLTTDARRTHVGPYAAAQVRCGGAAAVAIGADDFAGFDRALDGYGQVLVAQVERAVALDGVDPVAIRVDVLAALIFVLIPAAAALERQPGTLVGRSDGEGPEQDAAHRATAIHIRADRMRSTSATSASHISNVS